MASSSDYSQLARQIESSDNEKLIDGCGGRKPTLEELKRIFIEVLLQPSKNSIIAGKPNNDKTIDQIKNDVQNVFAHSLNCGFLSVEGYTVYVRNMDDLKLLVVAEKLEQETTYKVIMNGEYYADVVYRGTSHMPFSLSLDAKLMLLANEVSIEFDVNAR